MKLPAQEKPDVFAAISHEGRRRMLAMLAREEQPVSALAAHFDMSRPAVSQHLRVLLDAGLLTERRQGRERLYHFAPERLQPVREWLAQYEAFWDERLLRLQTHLNKRKPK